MPNQEQSRDGIPREDKDRPSPDEGGAGTESPSAQLGAPNPGLSDRNGPGDPEAKRNR